jgi:hypothetical protein
MVWSSELRWAASQSLYTLGSTDVSPYVRLTFGQTAVTPFSSRAETEIRRSSLSESTARKNPRQDRNRYLLLSNRNAVILPVGNQKGTP